MIDEDYMRRAMALADRGRGFVNPNPLVGAVIVRDGNVIGEGWHERFGGLHAERNALARCSEDPRGATMYVTLEPCCHWGKTPPCADALIEAGIARVVVGLGDPNPLVAGKGLAKLSAAGIEVMTGVLEDDLRWQNRVFLKYITTRRPWVTMKTAMTLDGKIASRTGDSRWVTGDSARQYVQRMRAEHMGIMVGMGTVRMDNPMLNCRLEGCPRQPMRIVVSTGADIPEDSQLVRTAREFPLLVAHTAKATEERLEAIRQAGGETLLCGEKGGRVDADDLLGHLGDKGIDSVLLEGGGELNWSFVRDGLVDEVDAFIAPKIVGGRDAKTPVEGEGFAKMAEAMPWHIRAMKQIGEDVVVIGVRS